MFPLPNSAVMPKIKWDLKQNPRQFLSDSKELWTKQTGHHPGNSGTQTEWFRQAVLKGVPDSVQNTMQNNPDMFGCDSTMWERHLIHHLTLAQDKTQQEEKELADLQAQLLKLQLTNAREEVNEKRKGPKTEKVKIMVQSTPDWEGDGTPAYPDLYPVPSWAPHRRGGGMHRGRGGPRGGGSRGAPGGRAQGGNRGCFLCGDPSHWVRECPQYSNQTRGGFQGGFQQQGNFQNRGGRSGGPQQQPGAGGAMGQFPLWPGQE